MNLKDILKEAMDQEAYITIMGRINKLPLNHQIVVMKNMLDYLSKVVPSNVGSQWQRMFGTFSKHLQPNKDDYTQQKNVKPGQIPPPLPKTPHKSADRLHGIPKAKMNKKDDIPFASPKDVKKLPPSNLKFNTVPNKTPKHDIDWTSTDKPGEKGRSIAHQPIRGTEPDGAPSLKSLAGKSLGKDYQFDIDALGNIKKGLSNKGKLKLPKEPSMLNRIAKKLKRK